MKNLWKKKVPFCGQKIFWESHFNWRKCRKQKNTIFTFARHIEILYFCMLNWEEGKKAVFQMYSHLHETMHGSNEISHTSEKFYAKSYSNNLNFNAFYYSDKIIASWKTQGIWKHQKRLKKEDFGMFDLRWDLISLKGFLSVAK